MTTEENGNRSAGTGIPRQACRDLSPERGDGERLPGLRAKRPLRDFVQDANKCVMEEISQQLLYQRLRNRVIDLMEVHSSIEDIARFGAYEMINLIDDILPLDYDEAPGVFSEKEERAVAWFLELAESAAEATDEDSWDTEWFENSQEWMKLSRFARHALTVFSERGRFSEEYEEF